MQPGASFAPAKLTVVETKGGLARGDKRRSCGPSASCLLSKGPHLYFEETFRKLLLEHQNGWIQIAC
jgi:hypothetical protein